MIYYFQIYIILEKKAQNFLEESLVNSNPDLYVKRFLVSPFLNKTLEIRTIPRNKTTRGKTSKYCFIKSPIYAKCFYDPDCIRRSVTK